MADINQAAMNTRFIYDHSGKKIEGIEFSVSIEIKLDLPAESPIKWSYVEFLNSTYEQAKHRVKSVSFGE